METVQGREKTINISHHFYDPIVEYMASFFGQKSRSIMGHVLNVLPQYCESCMPILVTDFQEHIQIRRFMQEIKINEHEI